MIRKESIGNCVRMKSLSESDYNECVMGLGKILDVIFLLQSDRDWETT